MPTQKQIRSFIQVSEAGSFYKAAEQLYISTTALLQQINLMEEEIGFKVFERTRRGVSLTPAGEYFLEKMKEIEFQMSCAVHKGQEIASGELTSITMGYVFWHSAQIALELNQQISESGMAVSVALISMEMEKAFTNLRNGGLTCCVMPSSERVRSSGLRYRLIKAIPLYIGLPENIRAGSLSSLRLEDLAGQKIILPKKGLFDSTDQVRDYIRERQLAIEIIEISDHLETELACRQYHACRISASVQMGSQLSYIPLKSNISYAFVLTYHPDRERKLQKILRLLPGAEGHNLKT